ncbi:MAG: hypothetical protein Q7T80_01910 [Methanoregula sp.]|nr:hypothetical protein [Methanoregula sp.]
MTISDQKEWQNPVQTTGADPEKTIRAFIGDPAAQVEFEKNITNTRGIDMKMYRVNDNRFTIDAETGTVIGVSVISPDSKKFGPLSRNQAEAVAHEYAIKHYPDFTTRNMQLTESRTIDHGNAGAEYSFTWCEQVFGINNGNRVGMSVDPNGKIMGYYAEDKPAPVIRPAKISKESAHATAVDYVISQTRISNITTIESASQLNVLQSDPGTVVWTVDLEIRFHPPGGFEDHRGGRVYVDAMQGTVLKYEPCM